MVKFRTIQPVSSPLDTELTVPASKSVTHRALVAAALADGPSTIRGPLRADDTRVTLDGLQRLGVRVEEREGAWHVHGCGGPPPGGGELWLEQSGTSGRFLLAVAATGAIPSRLDGSDRLRRRPMEELVTALRELGAAVGPAPAGSELPRVTGGGSVAGGTVRLAAHRSSQFASALLLIGARLSRGLDLTLEPPVVSLPYADLTADVITAFGVRVERPEPLRWRVKAGGYPGRDYLVEGDHSTASYFLAAPAVAGGRVRVRGLNSRSRQPDARLGEILRQLGCDVERGPDWIEVRRQATIPGFDLAMGEAPDLVPTLAALALFAEGPCRVRNVGHLRLKESDRLDLLARNLVELGREARVTGDRLEIGPPRGPLRGGTVVTGGDHRIAMAFAMAGLGLAGITLDDPSCVTKSDPDFWERFEALAR